MVSRLFPGAVRNEKWCERGESNPHGLAPGGFSYPLRLSLPSMRFGVWIIPSPCREHAFAGQVQPVDPDEITVALEGLEPPPAQGGADFESIICDSNLLISMAISTQDVKVCK
jgi:hypothetical protein